MQQRNRVGRFGWRLWTLLLLLSEVGFAAPALTLPRTQIQPDISRNSITIKNSTPVIISLKPTACVARGGNVSITGKGFGSAVGKGVALGGKGIHVDTKVLVWGDNAITVRIPDDPGIQPDKQYYLGIERANHTEWLSNLDKSIVVCAQSRAVQTGNNNPPAQTTTPPSAENGGNTGGFAQQTNTANAPNPPAYGTLLQSPLPQVPELPQISREVEQADIEPGEVIVIHTAPEQAKQFATSVREMGFSIKRRRTLKGLGLVLSVIRLPAGKYVGEALQQIRDRFPDLWVDANHRYTLQSDGDPKSYARRLVGLSRRGTCRIAPKIGMIDTGIVSEHPALRGADVIQKSLLPIGVKAAPSGHGTAIAALLVGRSDAAPIGLLPDAQLHVAAIFRSRDDDTQDTSAERIVHALDWLMQNRVTTINLSLGGPRNLMVEAALHRVLQAGVAVVAAAGNGGSSGKPVYPAAQPGVVAVTAVDADSHLYRHATRAPYVTFSAPGVDVWSASEMGAGAYFSGTSYAVPFVTAALATRATGVSSQTMIDRLAKSAIDLGRPGRDPEYGWGLVQIGMCDSKNHP